MHLCEKTSQITAARYPTALSCLERSHPFPKQLCSSELTAASCFALLLCSYSEIPEQLNADVRNCEWESPLLGRSSFSGRKQGRYCIGKPESNGARSPFLLTLCKCAVLSCLRVTTRVFFLILLAGKTVSAQSSRAGGEHVLLSGDAA